MFEELIRNFHFLRPWILLLLFVPLFFYFYLFKNVANLSSWEKVCDKKLLEFLLVKGKSSKRKTGVFLMYLGLVCAVVSAAGPTWKRGETNALNNQNPVMVVLNLSSDMLQTDIKPDRLQRAKIEITQLLNKLQSSETGLIVHTQEPFLISPLSVDNQLIINLLDAISTEIMPVNGDRLDRAIALAIKSIKDAGCDIAVVGSAIIGIPLFTVFDKPFKETTSSLSGFVIIIEIPFAVSITDPPPTATITSAPYSLQTLTPSCTFFTVGFGLISE